MDVQKGYIFDMKRFAVHDGPGIRTTAFFQGCPLNCPWCHNPESRDVPGKEKRLNGTEEITVPELTSRLERDRIFYEESGGGVTFSGGEPLSQPHFLDALLSACRERGLHTALDTCGHAPPGGALPLLRRADLVLFDIKILSSRRHLQVCGTDNTRIMANLEGLLDSGNRLWLRFPLIPGYTDSEDNINGFEDLVRRKAHGIERISILPFHPAAEHKYRRLDKTNPMQGVPLLAENQAAALKNRLDAIHPAVHIGG